MFFEFVDPDIIAALGGASAIRGGAALPAARVGRRSADVDTGVEIVATRRVFERLEAPWRALEQAARGALVFQSFAWCRAVWDHQARLSRDFRPRIVTASAAGRLVGILPLRIARAGMASIATGLGEPYQQYTDVLLAPDAPEDTAARLIAAAGRMPGCDGLEFLKVRDDSALAALLNARGAARSNASAAPFVDLMPFPAFANYHANVNAKTRKNMRNARNRLARIGRLDHVVHTDSRDIAALVSRAHAGRERWLSQQGLTSRAFRDPSFGAFAQALARPRSGIDVLAMSLTLDGQPIADQWGLVFNDRYYAYFATWDPAYEACSPGKLHLEEVIRAVHDRGLAVADFLMPALPYKLTWTDSVTPVADYSLALSFKARLQFSVWSGIVRPFLKRLAYRLPPGFRAGIARIMLPRR